MTKMLSIYYMLRSILVFDVYLRNDCFIIIFIECFQLLVSQKNNVCVSVCVCLDLICYYNLYVVVD